ncbi:MAG: hypothetical protein WB579_26280 [Bryobacteraceae bacterium]
MPFHCSICDEPSTRICVRCTKDACDNHICEKCLRCSDCCECEVALNATRRVAPIVHTPPAPEPELEAVTEDRTASAAEPPASEAPASDPAALAEPCVSDPLAPADIPLPVPDAD